MKRLGTIFLAFSLIAVLATISFAQELSQFGVKAGLNRPSMRGDEVDRVKLSNKNEMIVGGFVTIGLNEKFAIQPEVYYVKKGGDRERFQGVYDITLTYVDIPILLRYNVQNDSKVKPWFAVGPMLSFNMDGTFEIAT
ncbi:MAG: PorT family protein, partial [bacterium]|nr:PorT family protein [bacterium]